MRKISAEIKEKRARKLLEVLNRVYYLTKDDYVNIPWRDYGEIHGMSGNDFAAMHRNFLDKKKGNTRIGEPNKYKWKSIKPNIYMARKFYNQCYESHKLQSKKQKNITELEHNLFTQQEEVKPIEQPKKPIEQPKKQGVRPIGRPKKQIITEPTKKEFNLFWGLIKIKY